MKKVTDIIINGNGLREIYTAVYYAKMGKSVILATDGEYLFREASECMMGFFEKESQTAQMLDYLDIPYKKISNSMCHIPQGDASIYALKTLRKYGVYILFDTVKIGNIKHNDKVFGGVFANKFGVFCIESKNVIEYPSSNKNAFSFQLSGLKFDGIKTPVSFGDIYGVRNVVLNRDSRDNQTGVVSFETDGTSMYQAFERMLGIIKQLKKNNSIFEECSLQKTAYSTADYTIGDLSVYEISDDYEKPDTMEISGRCFGLFEYLNGKELDEVLPFDTYMINPSVDMAESISASAVISGAGTGGVCAYMALEDGGADDVVIIDRAHLPGGTRTLGMVHAFWYGYQDGFAKENKMNIEKYLSDVLPGTFCRDYTGELLYYVHRLKDNCRYSSYLCGAKCEGNRVEGVFVASDGKLTYIKSDYYIDATGDGDTAVFSGCKYRECGDVRDGFPQSFSIWGETEAGKLWSQSRYHGDEENISTEKYSEYVRGIIASDSVNSPGGFSPVLTVRESRGICGEYMLTLGDIITGKIFDDTISVSEIYFDAHGQGSSRAYYTRLFDALLTKTKQDKIRVRLPFRALIPEGISNLIVVSKAISATRDAAGMVRMNPDIQNTAYAAGTVVTYMIKNSIRDTRAAYDDNVKNILVSEGILPEWTFVGDKTCCIDKIRQKEMIYLARASLEEDKLSELINAYDNETDEDTKYLFATALLGLKCDKPYEYMLDKLGAIIKSPDDIVNNSRDIMSIIILLSYISTDNFLYKERFMELLVTLADNITSGGETDFSGQSVYAASKIHATVVVNFNLLMALSFVCEENADERLTEPLKNLIAKDGIAIDKDSDVFAQHLYIRLLSALYRSGDAEAGEKLKGYVDDEHYFFRTFAAKELDEIKAFPCPVKDNWELWI